MCQGVTNDSISMNVLIQRQDISSFQQLPAHSLGPLRHFHLDFVKIFATHCCVLCKDKGKVPLCASTFYSAKGREILEHTSSIIAADREFFGTKLL